MGRISGKTRSAIRAGWRARVRRGRRTSAINIVFDGPPAPRGLRLVAIRDEHGRLLRMPPEVPRLVEFEDDAGRSLTVGEWVAQGDGYWAVRVPCQLGGGF
jgi:hypothetical protein